MARSDEESLLKEASSLSVELAELRARLEKATNDRGSILEEIRLLDQERESVEREISGLEEEIDTRKETVYQLIRSLYLQENTDVLEVLVEARDLDALWREAEIYRRLLRAGREAAEGLLDKRDRLAHRRAELRDLTLKKQELIGSLDLEGLQVRIRQVEERLTAINLKLREIRSARGIVSVPLSVPTPVSGRLLERVPEMPSLSRFQRTGIVYQGLTSWYGSDFHGKPTASGIPFNMYDFTCAHPFLPLGTWLLVTLNGKQVVVQVNDRGPFIPGRVLDLSWRAAREIGLGGVARTTFEVLIPLASDLRR
ncbi:MAG: septal ring lytic transglycosylase RlpA family protein [Candidatus Geothermincolales bacterium]